MSHSMHDRVALSLMLASAAALAGCAGMPPATSAPLSCDDGIKAAFRPGANTTVIAVRNVKKGEALVAVDSSSPITAASDMCMVKLLVGPGVTAEKDRSARSFSEGIGIEVWLPAHASWNERIRNYGGGGWVGGGHRDPGKIGSKVPAIVNANIGYAAATTDAGQPWYQDGSFAFLSNGKVNQEGLRDFNQRAIYEQAVKTRALVRLYYGKPQKFAYFDGHSQGGRQGMKMMQEFPELYDGYLIAAPAIHAPRFGVAAMYAQIVMKSELGFTAADKPQAAAFAKKVEAANARAVASCDKEKLGFLLDPFACSYDPGRDAAGLCAGVTADGIAGTNPDAANCMTPKEALALAKIWYGPTVDGSYNPAQDAGARGGRALEPRQLWWGFTRGTAVGGGITSANTDNLALALEDVSYAADASTTSATPISNTSTPVRNKWRELTYASFAEALSRGAGLPSSRDYLTDNTDLGKLQALRRKVIVHNGLADDAIPPSGAVNYYQGVAARMGGDAQAQQFLRMYLVPGMAHSSQGRGYTVGGRNAAVPMPLLPGNSNQAPAREQDPMFSALVDWVEQGVAPGDIVVASRDNGLRYPLCVYPKKTTWTGGSTAAAGNFACR